MNQPSSFNIIVLLSGYGSNLQAIIDAIANKTLHANLQAVISDNESAFGLTRAKKANINTHVIDDLDKQLPKLLNDYSPDLIVLAGFMKILPSDLVKQYPNKMINIHPSLLPKYRGLNTHQKVLDAGDKQHGTSVHFVTEDLDAGPIISQATLEVNTNETAEQLKARVQKLEHELYPKVIQWFVEEKV